MLIILHTLNIKDRMSNIIPLQSVLNKISNFEFFFLTNL